MPTNKGTGTVDLIQTETGIKVINTSGMSRQAPYLGALSLKPSRFFYESI